MTVETSGARRCALGIVLLLFGGVLLVLAIRRPLFDPALARRSTVLGGAAPVEVASAGDYAVYLEDRACTAAPVELRRVGHRPVSVVPLDLEGFTVYEFDDRCAQPLGVASLPSGGLWSAGVPAPDGARLAVYPADAPPSTTDWRLSWLFVPVLAIGLVTTVQGGVRHARQRLGIRLPTV